MKKKIFSCSFIFLLILIPVVMLGIEFVKENQTTSTPTPTSLPTSTVVVVINEISYNFPVEGIVDTYPVTTPGTINVRVSPSFDGNSILTTAENGTEFMLLGITEDGQFFISEYEGQTVFLSTKVIKIDG